MQVLSYLKNWYADFPAAVCLLAILSVGVTAAAVAGYVLKSTGAYAAMLSIALGVFSVAVLSGGMRLKIGFVCLSLLAIYGGVNYLLLFFLLGIRLKIKERKRRRAEIARRVQFALPDRNNSYVRERLQTALHVPTQEEKNEAQPLYLGYATELLSKLKNAPLSVSERLRIEEMGAYLALCKQMPKWQEQEVKSVNEVLAQLLKMAAKYEV